MIVNRVIESLLDVGVSEFCLCPGARNSPFIVALEKMSGVTCYYWPEERSASFFALGRVRRTGKPVAVIVTSGTAAGELLPAAMEAFYSGDPIILLTADRPRRFRGSNAPQSCEQVNLFGVYTPIAIDIEGEEELNLSSWNRRFPLQLNVCLEEPKQVEMDRYKPPKGRVNHSALIPPIPLSPTDPLVEFIQKTKNILVVVGCLPEAARQSVIRFLKVLKAPVYLEASSNIREESSLDSYRITVIERIWERSEAAGYPIDGVLRIGGVPTARLWRDLEEMAGKVAVFSISELPFSGLSWARLNQTSISQTCDQACQFSYPRYAFQEWKELDRDLSHEIERLFKDFPRSEPALVRSLAEQINPKAVVYLGNSLPIREWDFAACHDPNLRSIYVSRGLNGIDGQLSTFLGLCEKNRENWGLFGDLTTLYDLAAPWISPQLEDITFQLVIINNGGGRIFDRMFKEQKIQNLHDLHFEHFARLWRLDYEKWDQIPNVTRSKRSRVIEIVPDHVETRQFLEKVSEVTGSCITRVPG